jgi:ATP-binding cassette subfamily B protein
MTDQLDNLCWPLHKLAKAMAELALSAGLLDRRDDAPEHSALFEPEEIDSKDAERPGPYIEAAAEWVGLEAEPLSVQYSEIEQVLRKACPQVIRLTTEEGFRFLAIARATRRNLYVAAPDGKTHRVSLESARAAIARQLDITLVTGLDLLLEDARVPGERRTAVRSGLLRELLGQVQIDNWWLVRLPPGANFYKQMRKAGLPSRLLMLTVLQFIQHTLLLASWWVIGIGALQGRFDRGWLLAWALLLFTIIPFKLMTTWLQGIISIGVGGLLKQRLLYGALRLAPDTVRKGGTGNLLGRVIESTAVEALATTGGWAALAAAIELLLAAFVLSKGAGGFLHVLLFACWVILSVLIAWRYWKRRSHWTDIRLSMTNDMVERMVGHRTRLSQESPAHWHDGEDELLANYIWLSKSIDGASLLLMGFIPRGWLLLGLIGLIPAITAGEVTAGSLAVSVGGLLLGYQSLGRLSGSLSQVAGAAIAWRQVRDLFDAAGVSEVKPSPFIYDVVASRSLQPGGGQKLIQGADLVYRYRPEGEPVLRHCSLEIFSGERILLEGPSGEGKSTLASLLVGLRMPESGLLLLEGLDYQSLGARGWRERVTASPQFHENHVLTASLSFNLLMGRGWPPSPADLEEADAICEELGLRCLLERMPSGLSQIVGETGWQLSHGERSRLFIARALLQQADLVVLDESFAALDPENLRLALDCALKRSRTLVVVAHP